MFKEIRMQHTYTLQLLSQELQVILDFQEQVDSAEPPDFLELLEQVEHQVFQVTQVFPDSQVYQVFLEKVVLADSQDSLELPEKVVIAEHQVFLELAVFLDSQVHPVIQVFLDCQVKAVLVDSPVFQVLQV